MQASLTLQPGIPMTLILPFFKKNIAKILGGLVCMVVVDLAQLAVPQIIKQAVDTLAGSHLNRSQLLEQCLLIAGLGLFMALLRYGWRMLLMGSARDLERGIRDRLYAHVLTLDMGFYDETKTGDIMAHATSDINHVRMAFGFGIIALVDTLLLGGTCIAIMAWTNPKLTLLTLLPMPLLVIATKSLGTKMHTFHRTAQESFSALTEQIREGFFSIRMIKAFNFEPMIVDRVEKGATDYFNKNLKRAVINALLRPLLGFFFNISTIIILFYGGYLVMQDRLSPGELVAFLQYLGILAWPVIAIGWMTNLFQRGMASLKRIQALLDARPAIESPSRPISLKKVTGGLVFEDVSFCHIPGTPVLNGINAEIKAGRRIGITGPPGSGKTSLLQLIPRLYDPDEGRVRLDGTDVKALDTDQLRTQIALMSQEPFLFSGTIEENILMGQARDDKRMEQVIDICDLKDTLARMPDGLATVVGERGVTLSGGQKQRVALARTLFTGKPVILLDDPVSQLDTRTAARIIARIGSANPSATMIMVSHRISALAGCDDIYILENGTISARGTHDDLKQSNPFYKEAFRVQQEASHA